MKRSVQGALLLVVALMISAPLMQAQSRIRAEVPFAFSMDGAAMPAGHYEIASLSQKSLVVRNLDNEQGRLVMKSQAVQASGMPHAMLVFHRYGDKYFLSQIWDGRSDLGTAFATSQREKELRMADNTVDNSSIWPETVVIGMK